jgi:SSS family solute:Na+ symporter/sodium/proline symporter
VGWVIGTVILETLIVVIAVIGSALFQSAPDVKPREIIPYTARHGMPPLLGAVLMGAVFAKVISTGNNYLFSPATNIVHDIYSRFINPSASNRRVLIVSRSVVILLGIFAFAQTFQESILKVMLYAYTVYSAAITPVVMAAFFWKRATRQAAVVSVAAGTLFTVAWNVIPMFYGSPGPGAGAAPPSFVDVMTNVDAIYPAVLVSVAALVGISLLTPPPSRQQSELLAATPVPATK